MLRGKTNKMTEKSPYILPLNHSHDVTCVGGKAANLARLMEAGFEVPDGFVVATQALRQAAKKSQLKMPEDLAAEITKTYREMGLPDVAVRSSATPEDMTQVSMAGQYESKTQCSMSR